MKTKKLLGMLLALTMVFSVVCIPQAVVVNAAYSDNVLFEYNFDSYTGGKAFGDAAKGTNVTLEGLSQSQTNKLFLGTEADGNKYLYSDVDAWLGANSGKSVKDWANAGFNVIFGEAFPSEGRYAVSFDLRMEAEAKDSSRNFTIRHDDKSFYTFAGNTKKGYFYGYKSTSTLDETGTEGKPYAIVCGKKYRIDLVYDLDNDTFKSYVDGTLLADRKYTGILAGQLLRFNMEQEVSYFDNLKIAKVTSSSFEATAKYANDTATISFTETLLNDGTLSADDFTATNTATGDTVNPISVEKTAYDEVVLTFATGALRGGSTYSIAFGNDVKNIAGNNVTGTTAFEVPAVERTVYVEDFEDLKEGEFVIPTTEVSGNMQHDNFYLLYNGDQVKAGSVRFKSANVVEAGENTKAIRVVRSAKKEDGGDMALRLPHKVYFVGDVSLEYRIRAGEGLDVFRSYLIQRNNMASKLTAASSIPSIFYEGDSVKYITNVKNYDGNKTSYKSGLVGNAYHTYKAVYHFDEETVDFYFDGEKLNSAAQPIANWNNIKTKGCFNQVEMRINNDEDDYVDIDYIKVTQTAPAPSVASVEKGEDTIKVKFAGNIDSATIAENITLTKNGESVAFTGEFADSDRSYTLTVAPYLAGDYVLSVGAGVKDTYGVAITPYTETIEGAFEVESVSFTKGGEAVSKADLQVGDEVEVTVVLKDTTGAFAPSVLIGTSFNGLSMANAELVDFTWSGIRATATAKVTVDSLDSLAISGFVFDKATLNPITDAPFVLQ